MNMKQQTTTPEQFLQLALENRSVSIGDNDGAVHEFLTGLEGVVNFGGVGWKHKRWEAWFDCGDDGVTVLYARKLEINEIVMNELMGQASNDWATRERELDGLSQFGR
tara:strand:+ start:121 stop:444 length:324 start_codon:yes stop_codon:yes gene_type:complete